jgi:hypothetical protein
VQIRKCISSLKNKGFRNIVVNGFTIPLQQLRSETRQRSLTRSPSSPAIDPRKAMSRVSFFVADVTTLFADHFEHHFEGGVGALT